jgi:Domain of unknown function (DUF4504)
VGEANLLFIRRDTLTSKIEQLSCKEYAAESVPIIVDLNSGNPTLAPPVERLRIFEALAHAKDQYLEQHLSSSEAKIVDLFVSGREGGAEDTVGLPFIAGFLLGYPSIYFVRHRYGDVGNQALSMQPLRKTSIMVHTRTHILPLMDFTVPMVLWEAPLAISDGETTVKELIGRMVLERLDVIRSNLTRSDFFLGYEVKHDEEEFTLPFVTL